MNTPLVAFILHKYATLGEVERYGKAILRVNVNEHKRNDYDVSYNSE
jgi:hypothetical protein